MVVKLYVRSEKTTMITGHVSMETMGTAHTTSNYAEGTSVTKLSPEDALAKEKLTKYRVRFVMIDLSNGIRVKLRARLQGIRETPTLLDDDKRFVGAKAIDGYVQERRTDSLLERRDSSN